MATPSHQYLAEAVKAWTNLLGPENVIIDEPPLTSAQTATFATTQEVVAIIKPADCRQVQECVRIAVDFSVPIYPISTGKNWGYGSRVPPAGGCAIMALDRLDAF